MFDFEDEMEDRWIEEQIENSEQEMHELIADLSPDQKKVYEVTAKGKQMVHEHTFILKSILLNNYTYPWAVYHC